MKRAQTLSATAIHAVYKGIISLLLGRRDARPGLASIFLAVLLSIGTNSANAALTSVAVHSCAPNVLDCAQTGPHDTAVFNAYVAQVNSQTLRFIVTQGGSGLTFEMITSLQDSQAGNVHTTLFGDQLALSFGGTGTVGMQATQISSLGFGPNGQIRFNVDYSVSDLAAPLTLDVYYALAPVPEPGTYAMLLAGLGVIARVARRRSVGARARSPYRE